LKSVLHVTFFNIDSSRCQETSSMRVDNHIESLGSAAALPRVFSCPVCKSGAFHALLKTDTMRIQVCDRCGVGLQNPQPSDSELADIYGPDYFIGASGNGALASQFETVKRETARLQINEVGAYLSQSGQPAKRPRLIEIGCGHGYLLMEARAKGFEVAGLDYSVDATAAANRNLGQNLVRRGTIDSVELESDSYDVCVIADVIEHIRDPASLLKDSFRVLKKGGALFLATPSLDSWSSRVLGRCWMEFKREHLYYFNRDTIKKLVFDAGFRNIKISSGKKVLTPEYIIGHFEKFPVPILSSAIRFACAIAPSPLLKRKFKIAPSGVNVLGMKL
jgi:SAM-dependent methyltransferase